MGPGLHQGAVRHHDCLPLRPPAPRRLPGGVHDADLGVHDADPGVHDGPIFAFTMRRSWRSRSRGTRKIIEHISLDGVIQASGQDADFPYGDWTAPYRTPAGRDAVLAAHGNRFDLLLGRRTYDAWSGYWPKAPSNPMSDALNAATKYIVTHRPKSLEWGPFEGLGPNIVEDIRLIKSHDSRDLVLSGSATLTSTVLEHGLADEFVLIVYPVLLGKGKRFFAEGTPARSFELVSTKAMPSGIILSAYKFAGALKSG
jgi:dihydrofolate reductase